MGITIIKQGRIKKHECKFACKNCGCEFIVDDTDIRRYIDYVFGEQVYFANCPCCHNKCDSKNIYEI